MKDENTSAGPAVGSPVGAGARISEEHRQQLLREVRAQSPYEDQFWVFGFGSLMWNPGVEVVARHGATLDGYRRKFHIWSSVGRGTPEQPGLGLCLEPMEGSCRGVVFRYRMDNLAAGLDYLWSREMGSGVYRPKWVPLVLDDGAESRERMALTFVINPEHPQYAGPKPAAEMAQIMSGACGKYGRCRDYLANTLAEMAKLGEHDPLLEEVLGIIDAEAA